MPMMENMGVRVIEERPFKVGRRAEDRLVYIHDFGMLTQDERGIDLAQARDLFHDCFSRVWNGEIEDDGFNRLVLSAGSELARHRGAARLLQVPAPDRDPVQPGLYGRDAVPQRRRWRRDIVKLFHARSTRTRKSGREGPGGGADRPIIETGWMRSRTWTRTASCGASSSLVRATLRTNFYQTDDDGGPKSYVSFKFASRQIDEIPAPAPLREIFVYSPRFEAVHLRFGLVARGGLRWSDRREDFRTEILGLVKAQQVKNAVIVPVGSKGGFVLQTAPKAADREAFLAEGVACYRPSSRGMLDITDNLVDGKVVPPKDVVRYDGDDPYLVVAADKGTATFSDIANEIGEDYGFWLGDAFASGGSAGYDHKKMGITARGAWESVKRHFREMGTTSRREDFTVVGVGDMSGDVFGNGMLLSKHIKLVGAFNHLHIFIDPDPDPAKSWAERKRLFDLPRSSWSDYDAKLISKGGGVFDRKAKSIKLTPEIKALFDIDEEIALTPNDLINRDAEGARRPAVVRRHRHLRQGARETNAEVGDRANDPLRVNGSESALQGRRRRRQPGHDPAARAHRVRRRRRALQHRRNRQFRRRRLFRPRGQHQDPAGRRGLARRHDRKAAQPAAGGHDRRGVRWHVLRDNYQQTQAISVAQSQAARRIDIHQRLIRAMERAGQLDRALEFLPDDEEIDERASQANRGLTRPELSVLLAYAKNVTYLELLDPTCRTMRC